MPLPRVRSLIRRPPDECSRTLTYTDDVSPSRVPSAARFAVRRALQILLALAGLACLAGLYPLALALRDGVASAINRQDQMILGIYIVLGVFLLNPARNPRDHRSLILFAGWSTVAHDTVMIIQGMRFHDLRTDLVPYTVIAVLALALIAMAPT